MSNEFTRDEVDSIYVHSGERFVVSLIVGYGGTTDDGVTSAKDAAAAALALASDSDRNGTTWFVHDRLTGTTHEFEQSDFERLSREHYWI